MPTATKLPKVSQYVKNVGKSIAFASIEGVKSNMPGMTNFARDNKEVFKDIYGSVKNMRQSMRKMDRELRVNRVYRTIEYGIKNMKEDAMSGNFYNKERTDRDVESILGMDEYDDNYEEYEVSHGDSSKATYEAINSSMNEFTIGTSTAVARGAEIIISNNKTSTAFMAVKLDKHTATINSSIGTVYNALNVTNAFLNGPMLAHLNNSKSYYESSLSIMQEQKAMILEMLEMQRNLYKSQSSSAYKSNKLDDIMGYDGLPNLKAYAKNIKSNIMNAPGAFGMLGMMSGNSGMNVPMMIASAPFALMMDAMVGLLTPKNLRKNMKLFDTAISSVFSNFIARINKNKNSGGEFAYLLGSIFGINIGKKETIDTSKYNKGAVPFDGITRKTIVEVIPGYLARIEAALTGSAERHYDPYKGVWKSAKTIESDFNTERNKHIISGNYDIETDLRDYKRRLSPKEADSLEKSLKIMMTKIFEDGGVFEPGISSSGERDRNGKAIRKTSGDAYKKYGFKSKAQFEAVLSQMSDSTFYGLAASNMRARNRWNKTLEEYENSGGPYNLMFNGAYDITGSGNRAKMSPSKFTTNNILTIAKDKFGNNIFDYLREISEAIKFKASRYTPPRTRTSRSRTVRVRAVRASASESSSEESSDDGDSDGSDDEWRAASEELYQEEVERENRRTFSGWVRDKLERTAVGRSMSKYMDAMGKIFAAPIRFTDKLLQKANDNLFKMMFGDGDLRDSEGHKITNVFEYIMTKIKNSFNELTNWIKAKLKDVLDPLWNKIKPYAEPVIGEIKSMGKTAYDRIKKGLNNTLLRRLNRGDVISADEVKYSTVDNDGLEHEGNLFNTPSSKHVTSVDSDGYEHEGDLFNSASGRYVTKRGLTMISPGEIIIPATFDKKKQKKMLALEKRDRKQILNHIGLHAEGNIDTDKLKKDLNKIYEENSNKTSISKNIASGIMGAGAGLLTGINPLLAAMAGAGLSILNNSDTLKNMVFGKVISENGDREGGIIPKNLQDAYKKYMPDMTDFGIAGGVLGLFTPFGLLGGAAIGAGVGFLKNNEEFKKFIFGDQENGKEGLISKESLDKAKDMIKKAAPNIAIGAGAAILAGPFGLIGNAALGAGIGLLSTTEGFHDFLFNKDTGILNAFNTGFLEPAKEKLEEFLEDFRSYARKNIIEPMKNFWKGFNMTLTNMITGIGEHIADKINDSFEHLIGLPLHDFMQEKIFRPIGKLVFGLLKAPIAVGKAVVAAPFRALGGIGNSLIAGNIRRGTAYSMSAAERLAWRDQHKIRFNPLRRDKYKEQDRMLDNMSIEQLESLSSWAKSGIASEAQLQRDFGTAKKDVSDSISRFFNKKGSNRFVRAGGYNKVNKITEIAQKGDLARANKMIDALGLNEEEKEELKREIADKVKAANLAGKALMNHRADAATENSEITKLIGRKFKGRSDKRKMYKSAEAELKARRSATMKENQSEETNAIDNLSQILKEKADGMLKTLKDIADYVQELVHPKANDTTPPGNHITNNDIDTSTQNENEPTPAPSLVDTRRVLEGAKKKKEDEDSKEAVEKRNEEEEREKVTEENTEANKKSVSVLESIKEALTGDDSKKKNGFLSAIMEKLGKVGRFLGITGLSLTGVSLAGYASEWFKVSVWPKLKILLFGTENEDGTKTGGFVGKLETIGSKMLNKVKGFLLGDPENGEEGIFPKIASWMAEKFNKAKTWLASKGGLAGIIEDATPTIVNGITLAINNIGAPLVSLAIKTLVSIVPGLIKALIEGFKSALPWGNRKIKESKISIVDPKALKSIDTAQDNANTAIIAASGGNPAYSDLVGSLKGIRDAAFSTATDIDITGSNEEYNPTPNDKRSDNILGALGQTTRTNDVVYDENGQPISDYTVNNTTDSYLSATAKAAYRNFLQSLAGGKVRANGKIINFITRNAGRNIANGAVNMVKPGILNKFKGAFQLTTGFGKTLLNTIGNAGKLGNAINTGAENVAANAAANLGDDVINAGARVITGAADDVAAASTKTGILSGIKYIFQQVGTTSIVSKICNCIYLVTSKKTTEAIVRKAIELIGEKIGNYIIGNLAVKALSSIGSIISKFSILQLAIFVKDFLYGYDNAYTILGIAVGYKEAPAFNVNLGIKCLCGLANMIISYITLGLLPLEIVIDFIADILFPLFEFDAGAFKKAREEAAKVMDDYNIEHPERPFDNLKDYNDHMLEYLETLHHRYDDGTHSGVSGKFDDPIAYDENRYKASTHTGQSGKLDSGSGRGRSKVSALQGRAHIYQSSAGLSNIPYGDSTIGEAGCAPVAAANLINGLGRNTVSSVLDAASYAERHGMTVPGGGTDINYFKSYLGSKDIPTRGTSNASTAMNALRDGNQVIMLGKDRYNGSSAPFGTEPHFITAKGISKSGNIIVEDPDLPNSTYEYKPKSIKDSMITSVIADTRNRKRRGKGRNYGRAYVMQSDIGGGSSGNGKLLYANAIINIATSQLGVSESSALNDVKYNSAFHGQRMTGSAYEWSTVFVWWCFNQAGASSIIGKKSRAIELLIYYQAKKQFTNKATAKPKAGDIIFFKDGGATKANKTGIVTSVNSSTISFIQGDYAGKVSRRYLGINHQSIVGYARPKYPYTYSSTDVVSMSKWGDNRNYKGIAFGTVSPNVTPPADNTNNNTTTTPTTPTVETDDNTITQLDNSIDQATQEQEEAKKSSGLFDAIRSYTVSIIKNMFGQSAFEAIYPEEAGSTDTAENAEGTTTSGNTNTNTGTVDYKNPGTLISSPYDTKAIYDALKKKGYSRAGIAGIMGNMNCESAYKSNNVQDAFEYKVGNDTQYTNAVNNKSYTEDMFNNDSVGYGLTQNTWWTKKQSLYNHTVKKGKSVADMQGQIDSLADYLSKNQPSLNSYLKTTTDIVGASDKFLYQYENPKNPELTINRRRDFAFAADNTYGSGKGRADSGMAARSLQSVSSESGRHSGGVRSTTVVTAESTEYIVFLKAIIDLLSNVSTNTAVLYKILELLSDRLGITVDTNAIESGERVKIMNDILNKTSDASTKAKIMNDKDTSFLLSAMMALASE